MREFERSLYPWNQDDNQEKDLAQVYTGFALPQGLEETLTKQAKSKRHRKRLPVEAKRSLEIFQAFLEDSFRDLSAWREKQTARQVYERLGLELALSDKGKVYLDKDLARMNTLGQELFLKGLLAEYKRKGEPEKARLIRKKLASLGVKA